MQTAAGPQGAHIDVPIELDVDRGDDQVQVAGGGLDGGRIRRIDGLMGGIGGIAEPASETTH